MKTGKLLQLTIALLLAGVTTPVTTLAQMKPPFSVTISAPDRSAEVGKRFPIDIKTANIETHEIRVKRENGFAFMDYQITVTGKDGQPVPRILTWFEKMSGKYPVHRSFQFHRMAPADTITDELNLSEYFDLSHPGSYKVSVSRASEPDYGGGSAFSNDLVITLLPAP